MVAAFCDEAYIIAMRCLPRPASVSNWDRYKWAAPYLQDAAIRAEEASALAANAVASKKTMQAMREALASHKPSKDRDARSSDAPTKVPGAIATLSARTVSGVNKRKAAEAPPRTNVSRGTHRVAHRSAQGDGESEQMVSRSATLVYIHSLTHLAVRRLCTGLGRGNMHNDEQRRVCSVPR